MVQGTLLLRRCVGYAGGSLCSLSPFGLLQHENNERKTDSYRLLSLFGGYSLSIEDETTTSCIQCQEDTR